MFNVCFGCGQYRVDKRVVRTADAVVAVCPLCEHAHPFLAQPLFVVNGASGAGKSTMLPDLIERLSKVAVVMEADILHNSDQTVQAAGDMWLRICKNIGQVGLPVVLVAAGLIPQNLVDSAETRYFSTIHHIALTCTPDEQRRRLAARPAWRGTDWQAQNDFNHWFLHESGMDLIDTTEKTVAQTAAAIADWVTRHLEIRD